MHKGLLRASFYVSSILLLTSKLLASVVTNGSFEADAIANPWKVTATLSHWNTPYSYVEIQRSGLYGPGNLAPDGLQWVELDLPLTPADMPVAAVPQIFQDVPTIAGGTYSLSFSYSPRPNYGEQILGVFWGVSTSATPPLVFQTGSSGSNPSLNWQPWNHTVFATESWMRLGFGSLANFCYDGNAGGNLLDNVALTLVTAPDVSDVPEPAPAALLLIAALVGGVLRSKRPRSATNC